MTCFEQIDEWGEILKEGIHGLVYVSIINRLSMPFWHRLGSFMSQSDASYLIFHAKITNCRKNCESTLNLTVGGIGKSSEIFWGFLFGHLAFCSD